MTLWQKLAGALPSPVLAGAIVLSAASPSVAGMIAAKRVALVEEVTGEVKGVQLRDYVTAGKVIDLGPKGSIVLTYMESCWRETITGGTVVVGVERSLYHLSKVEGVKVDCDRGSQPVTDQRRGLGGTVFRGVVARPRPGS